MMREESRGAREGAADFPGDIEDSRKLGSERLGSRVLEFSRNINLAVMGLADEALLILA
jgi:hypothetical protein